MRGQAKRSHRGCCPFVCVRIWEAVLKLVQCFCPSTETRLTFLPRLNCCTEGQMTFLGHDLGQGLRTPSFKMAKNLEVPVD